MPRNLRIQDPGAMYHLMSRGDFSGAPPSGWPFLHTGRSRPK